MQVAKKANNSAADYGDYEGNGSPTVAKVRDLELKVESEELLISNIEAQINQYRSYVKQHFDAIVSEYGRVAIECPGFNGTVDELVDEWFKNPQVVYDKFRAHFLSNAVPSNLTLDGRALVLAFTSNPREMDNLYPVFSQLDPEQKTHKKLREMSEQLLSDETVYDGVHANSERARLPGADGCNYLAVKSGTRFQKWIIKSIPAVTSTDALSRPLKNF